DRLTSKRALYVEIRNLREMKDSIGLYQSAGYSFEPHLNYLLDLRGGEERVLSRMSKGRRKGIAKAERDGLEIVEVESESQIHSLYEIIKKKYSDFGIPLADESLFQSAFKILTPLKEVRFLLCRSEGRTIACRGVLLFGKTVYDWYAGSLSGEREKKPDEYLVWNILKWAISGGFETFDFGGAGQPKDDYGPREFKRRFGGEMVEPGRFKKVYKPRQLWISTKAFQVRRRLK
ncbi:MAG: GNAT family N-acetyltransferase, partial [Thermoplasmata archaeon]|nr:GNAT family N-acetyltransferase [Thermoplasmata archaeon]